MVSGPGPGYPVCSLGTWCPKSSSPAMAERDQQSSDHGFKVQAPTAASCGVEPASAQKSNCRFGNLHLPDVWKYTDAQAGSLQEAGLMENLC